MNKEHERKFLVIDPSIVEGRPYTRIEQGYLRTTPGYSFRVRYQPHPLKDDGGETTASTDTGRMGAWPVTNYVITVKGPRQGPTRPEEECCIPDSVAELLKDACGDALIEKNRYPIVGPDGEPWIIDEFLGRNQGLLLAELEQSTMTAFIKPDWCGEDVTEDERYYNDYLSRRPYASWQT